MKIIEFLGMPKAGKTTQLEYIETVLKHEKKHSVKEIHGGSRVCMLDKENKFLYNTGSFHSFANELTVMRLFDLDYLLIDRGVYDHIAFAHALYKSGQVTKEQYDAQAMYFRQFSSLEDLVLVFLITPCEAMRREHRHHDLDGRIMNRKFLSFLYDSYHEIIPEIDQEYIIINGSKPRKDNKKKILDFVVG